MNPYKKEVFYNFDTYGSFCLEAIHKQRKEKRLVEYKFNLLDISNMFIEYYTALKIIRDVRCGKKFKRGRE